MGKNMVFEVDNTTEKLIHELQASISATIETLRQGQGEIQRALTRMSGAVDDAASAAQADSISESLSRANASLRQLATAEIVSQLQREISKLQELAKQSLEDTRDAGGDRRAILDGIQNITTLIEQLTTQEANSLQIVSQHLQSNMERLQSSLQGVSSAAAAASKSASENQRCLRAISAYLSLPGYKRIFKGMEALQDETNQG